MSGECTIFVVDDDPGIVLSLSRLIRAKGYDVEPFTSVEAFLRSHNIAVPGCAILDVEMGRWNGLDVAKQLSNGDLKRQIIFISGYGDLHTGVQAIKSGAVDCLTKPVSDVDLFYAIREALTRDCDMRSRFGAKIAVQTRLERLTRREYQVFLLMIEGRRNKQIALELGTVEKTIKVHRARVIKKMDAENITDLVRMANRAGIIVASGS